MNVYLVIILACRQYYCTFADLKPYELVT